MSISRQALLGFVEGRLRQLLGQPMMWGQAEAVELQVLLLLEMRSLAFRPGADTQENFSALQTAYHRFLDSSGVKGPHLLSSSLDDVEQLVERIGKFVSEWHPSVDDESDDDEAAR